MGWWGGGFPEYVSVGERARRAKAAAAKLAKQGHRLEPVEVDGRKFARTFWGKAWCDHLASYSDFANRLPRGRSYLVNGLVIDLQMQAGRVDARVYGSELYRVTVTVGPLAAARWKALRSACAGRIDSLIELLQGRLSDDVMRHVCDRERGLFPAPREIELKCSCPDFAGLCKHLAAVLYGVGARLDREPALLFTLRGVDHAELVAGAAAAATPAPAAGTALAGEDLGALFGIDLAAPPAVPARAATKRVSEPAAPTRVTEAPAPKSVTEAPAPKRIWAGRVAPQRKAPVRVRPARPAPPARREAALFRTGAVVLLDELAALEIPEATWKVWLGEGLLKKTRRDGEMRAARGLNERVIEFVTAGR